MARKPTLAEVQMKMDFFDYLESLETRATEDIAGVWYNRLGAAKHAAGTLSQWDMFSRPWAHVARYASEELTLWFAMNGRMTFTEYREQIRQNNREEYQNWLDYRADAA